MKFDHVIDQCTHTSTCGLVTDGSFVAQRESRFRIINCSQEETFSNLLSRLEKDKFSESDSFFFFFKSHPGILQCD